YARESGKGDELDPTLAKPGLCLSREGAPVALRDHRDRKAGRGRDPEARRFGPAADDESDLGRAGLSRTRGNQGLQVGSAARDQYADPQPRHHGFPALKRRSGPTARRVRLSMASVQKLLYD